VNRLHALVPALCLAALTGCGPNLCEKSSAATAGKSGSCNAALAGLGNSCSEGISSCSDAEKKTLEALVSCLDALPVCSPVGESAWIAARDACYAKAQSLGATCRDTLFGSALPGVPDGGPAYVPRSPDTDGSGNVDLVAVGDADGIALAWSTRQPGSVAGWEIHSVDGAGASVPMQELSDGESRTFLLSGLGADVERSVWVVGVDTLGNVAVGVPAQSGGTADAGTGCAGAMDCTYAQVCDLGTCRTLACQGGGQGSCPSGYACDPNARVCVRVLDTDGGVPTAADAGTPAPQGEQARPFVSERRTARTGAGGFGEPRTASDFPADQDPEIAALDSARQVMLVQQAGQLFSHATKDRGASWSVTTLDAIGQRAHLAWAQDTGQLYACYQVGTGVRVRTSSNGGLTWDRGAAEVTADSAGGGTPGMVRDCDIAPWSEGRALLVTTEPEGLFVRTVDAQLNLGERLPAFPNESSTGGVSTVFAAEQPSIATDPSKSIVHVVFTGTRNLIAGGTDKDVYGVYRDPAKTGGTFSTRQRLTLGAVGSQGQNLLQDHPQVAVEPGSGRAIAAFQSEEPGANGATPFKTVYVAMFGLNAASPGWATGSDLTVFVKDNVGNHLVMTERPAVGAPWDAITPAVAITPGGKAVVSFAAGPQGQPASAWAVGFSFAAQSQVGTAAGKGWFLPPAKRLGGAPVVNFSNTPKGAGPVAAADGQLSTYVGYIEGVGGGASTPASLLVVSSP
jgi:hypothetical protein